MTNGLVFLFELGPFDVKQAVFGTKKGVYVNPNSESLSNGYISRAIRMIKNIFSVITPQLLLKFTEKNILFILKGCKNG